MRMQLLETIREPTALRASGHRAGALRRELGEPIDFLRMVKNREQFVSFMASGVIPEQEEKLRNHLKVGTRKHPREDAPAVGPPAAPPPG